MRDTGVTAHVSCFMSIYVWMSSLGGKTLGVDITCSRLTMYHSMPCIGLG